ncbi:uncharacterized protein LOC112555532 [Pomacea canaliculata]|uniref:uncharacterized protein LOC112555532 n=1 Tax=Pomacea canaliculata TaxID=400727 RepID=UPI000D73DB03|nr:uncharacterized protein LOC112555532 [Pomacea canaliculata]
MAGGTHSAVLCILLCLAVTAAGDNHTLAISRSTSSFGAALYKRLASGNQDNIIYSPISVYTALAMTFLGSGGVTERELRRALAVSPGQNLHSDLLNLFPSFVANDPDANLTLRIANALYYDAAEVNLTDSYVANVNQYYQTGLRAFQRPNPEQAINNWVEQVTEGAISNFLQPGAITPDTIIMLLNAVFFEAQWLSMFDPSDTQTANFTTMSGVVKQVPLMYQQGFFSVKNVRELDSRVLELPYKGGNHSLFIVLPNRKNGIRRLERKLTAQNLERALTSMPDPENRRVYLPKFGLRMRKSLNQPLQALGLDTMFDATRANFSGMVLDEGVAVSEVLHEALIEVTESGTKAAAVTAVIIVATSIILPAEEFRADRPFLLVLRDKVNAINIFVGRVADPAPGALNRCSAANYLTQAVQLFSSHLCRRQINKTNCMSGEIHSPVLLILLCLAVTTASLRHRRASDLSLSTSSFGTSMYKRLAAGNQDNIIYSPLSVYTALTMTLLGAGGDTEQELRTTLAVQPGQNVHSDINTLMNSMTTNDPAANLTLRMANALYYDAAQVHISDSYANSMSRYYGTGLQPFQRPNPEQAINTWVEEVTKRAITNFLQPGSIQSDTVIMLLNAVFFEASWRTTFTPSATRDDDFTTISGTVKRVPLMFKEGSFSVKNVPELDARVLELPYKGGDYSLFILLPNTKTGLTDLESKLTGQILEGALTSMPFAQHREVYIPKFTLRMRKGLNEPLEALGLNAMFDAARANLTGMVDNLGGRGLVVSKALHEAMIEVTESGTKAAAVTSISISLTAAFIPQPSDIFKVDHSFLFVLRDKTNRGQPLHGSRDRPTSSRALTCTMQSQMVSCCEADYLHNF